jgi:hypothetical protein
LNSRAELEKRHTHPAKPKPTIPIKILPVFLHTNTR